LSVAFIYNRFMRNFEFKARLGDAQATMRVARNLGADLWGDLRQTDTYFATPRGRLKLRETPGFQAELVFYERDEASASRPSDYQIAHTPDAEALRLVLSGALGVLTVVRKRRTLLLLDTTRIHLDNVDGLGEFLEIEAPVKPDSDEDAVKRRLDTLVEALDFQWSDCIRASYLDLMLAKSRLETTT
jgi:adenylate cyclase, class 2